MSLPRYDDLPVDATKPLGSSWGVFGEEDRVGTLNLIGSEQVRAAAASVQKGVVFSLNWDIALPDPPILGRRALRTRYVKQFAGWDDYYDSFFPQASTQWDALNHVHHPVHGYYNGNSAVMTPEGLRPPLGIDDWARRGIVGRFVLLDIARHFEEQGTPLEHAAKVPVSVEDLEAVAEREGVEILQGDILLLRFGWIGWYEGLAAEGRAALASGEVFPNPGLAAGEATARWLWDRHVAAVVGDNPTLEATPFDQSQEDGFLHYRLIPLLGLAIGELFVLDRLAEDCAADGVYHGLFTAAPLNNRGGVGSPGNALAVK